MYTLFVPLARFVGHVEQEGTRFSVEHIQRIHFPYVRSLSWSIDVKDIDDALYDTPEACSKPFEKFFGQVSTRVKASC